MSTRFAEDPVSAESLADVLGMKEKVVVEMVIGEAKAAMERSLFGEIRSCDDGVWICTSSATVRCGTVRWSYLLARIVDIHVCVFLGTWCRHETTLSHAVSRHLLLF